ncbi:hypothetical protein BB558_000103 [Smittium angustum]|uniref:Uncharacterized protein n=1 Tax=Smittium angustum TaxID=133377 RepID=A0A2U1JF43_SMIAN|nr:hypothetical protein BB558_000103 [Smittium angustum]
MAKYLDYNLLLFFMNILNILVCMMLGSVGLSNLISRELPTSTLVYNFYIIMISLALIVCEFKPPLFLAVNMKFLLTYRGRGLFYIFFGCLVYTRKTYNIVVCFFVEIMGVLFFVLSWVDLASPQYGIMYNYNAYIKNSSLQSKNSETGQGNILDNTYNREIKKPRILDAFPPLSSKSRLPPQFYSSSVALNIDDGDSDILNTNRRDSEPLSFINNDNSFSGKKRIYSFESDIEHTTEYKKHTDVDPMFDRNSNTLKSKEISLKKRKERKGSNSSASSFHNTRNNGLGTRTFKKTGDDDIDLVLNNPHYFRELLNNSNHDFSNKSSASSSTNSSHSGNNNTNINSKLQKPKTSHYKDNINCNTGSPFIEQEIEGKSKKLQENQVFYSQITELSVGSKHKNLKMKKLQNNQVKNKFLETTNNNLRKGIDKEMSEKQDPSIVHKESIGIDNTKNENVRYIGGFKPRTDSKHSLNLQAPDTNTKNLEETVKRTNVKISPSKLEKDISLNLEPKINHNKKYPIQKGQSHMNTCSTKTINPSLKGNEFGSQYEIDLGESMDFAKKSSLMSSLIDISKVIDEDWKGKINS